MVPHILSRLMAIGFLLLVAVDSQAFLSRQEAFDQTFDMVWSTVNESHWDENFGGLDWEDIREKYFPRVKEARDRGELAKLLQSMLNELELSHYRILSSSSEPLDSYPRGGFTGLELKYLEGRAYVTRVVPQSPAAEEGIQVGWRLKAIHGRSVKMLTQFLHQNGLSRREETFYIEHYLNELIQGGTAKRIRTDWYPPGKRATKRYLQPIPDKRDLSAAVGYLPSQRIEYESRHLKNGILYLRFNAFVPDLMDDIRDEITNASSDMRGIILDLRRNLGGLAVMASGITGLLVDEPMNLGKLVMKRGYSTYQGYPQTRRFSGPVAILVDGSSASTTEILAGGLQEAGRARIFGETTFGQSLPSLFKKLPSGDVLQYAVGDYLTPGGYRIEKNGVVPDEVEIPQFRDLEQGRDLPLERAIEWLNGETQVNEKQDAA